MITRKIHRSKNCLKNTLFKMIKKMKKIIYIDGSVNVAVKTL